MSIKVVIKRNTYFDSVSLMSLSTKANQIEGVEQAIIGMGTEMNKGVIRNVGLMTPEVEEATAGDLMIIVKTTSADQTESAYLAVEELLTNKDKAQAKVILNMQRLILLHKESLMQTLRSFPSMVHLPFAKHAKHLKMIYT